MEGTVTIESLVHGTLRSEKYQTENQTIETAEAGPEISEEVAQYRSAEQTETDYSSVYASN